MSGRGWRGAWRWVSALAGAALLVVPAHAGEVAVTMDDLPLFGRFAPPADAERITDALLAGFRRNGWRVTGFVNEVQLEGPTRDERIGLLRRWLSAGEDLGNHGYAHLSFTHTPVDQYIADVARGDAVTRGLVAERGGHERYFRYPFLETGPTPAARQQFEAWLAAHGYQAAPVTMENSDWAFAEAYDAALARGDTARAAAIRDSYLRFSGAAIPWYRQAATALLGREPRFVLLLHASRLNSVSVDALAEILRANRLRPVTLARALRDPAYRIADDYAGPDGDEWLSRWSATLKRPLDYAGLPQLPADIAADDAAPSPP